MNIIFWYFRDENIGLICKFIFLFSNLVSLITKIELIMDIEPSSCHKITLNKNINLKINYNNISNEINNFKKINILFLNYIYKNKEKDDDDALIIFLDLEKINENYLFNILKNIKLSGYTQFLFIPFKKKNINKVTEAMSLNFLYQNISKKMIFDVVVIDSEIQNKKLEKILKKIR